MIPFFSVARENQTHIDEYTQRVREVLLSGQMLQGEWTQLLESRLSGMLYNREAVCVNSCTDALFFALKYLGIKEGDEVLVPAFSFVASASCILRVRASPIFVDVASETGNIDLEKAADLVTERTVAMIIVHLYGRMICPTDVWKFSGRQHLFVVEDAAQAFGAEYEGHVAGQVGIAACFSFDPTKNLSAPGSGGAVVYPADPKIVQSYRYHDKMSGYTKLGYNSQLPEISAALLDIKLNRFWENQERRHKIAEYYSDTMHNLPLGLPKEEEGTVHSYHKFVIRSEDRDTLRDHLSKNGIETKIHYPLPLPNLPMFEIFSIDCPNAEKLSREVLSLPIHPYLSDAEVEFVAEAVLNFYRK